MIPNRLLFRTFRIVAIALGVWGALWLLAGDRDPDASTEPVSTNYTTSAVIHWHEGFDFSNVQFFELAIGSNGALASGTRIVVSADGDLAVTKWLVEHNGERVSFSLQARDVLTRSGDGK